MYASNIIELSTTDVSDLIAWRNSNTKAINEYSNVIDEGIIEIQNASSIYFKFLNKSIVVYKIYYQTLVCAEIIIQRTCKSYNIIMCRLNSDYVNAMNKNGILVNSEKLVNDANNIISSCMAFMEKRKGSIVLVETFRDRRTVDRAEKIINIIQNRYKFKNIVYGTKCVKKAVMA